ncbi:hypothetical protein FHR81_000805 [Actinoalloteichus hoggarensis]|uniref:Uncharacterized protein n=1 Tax=Actinoalloteichus hoggarensis TaxID=1470176 RepID=A0A221W155_9PSEU|nr:hypothetical protein [Actinoalloteichus hoggarensis]ASO19517.1 hypothetical protein AHOG_09365 [Actinoalloteichus hoggarensis]MBB5919776.1 hypothetical protein [Actinoalloteichus hoggarensis]
MLDPHWVFAGAVLGLVGSVRYAFAITRGRVRPNLVTWSLWAAAPLIGFFAQLDSEVGLPAVMTLAAGAGPLIVILTSVIARRHYTRLGVLDLVCAGIASLALCVWLGLGAAPLAVLFAVAADAVAAPPTIVKAWRHPDSENVFFYVLVGVGATITLLTIASWEPQSWAFALYQVALCVLLIGVIATRRRAHATRLRPRT